VNVNVLERRVPYIVGIKGHCTTVLGSHDLDVDGTLNAPWVMNSVGDQCLLEVEKGHC
jgi:hypothetical protein